MKKSTVKITDKKGVSDVTRMATHDALLLSKPAGTVILYTVGGTALTAVPFGAIVGALIGLMAGNAKRGAVVGATGGLALSGITGATAAAKRASLKKKFPFLQSVEIIKDASTAITKENRPKSSGGGRTIDSYDFSWLEKKTLPGFESEESGWDLSKGIAAI
jgi:hypothetical protein